MKLTTNLSDPLIELLENDSAPIDGIEVGPWAKPKEIIQYRRMFPKYPYYFHGGEIINRIGLFPGSTRIIKQYINATESPWVSLHITYLLPRVRRLFIIRGWRIPSINPDRATREFIKKVAIFARNIHIPVILENPDPIPMYGNPEIQTNRITEIIETTNSGLLLDIGHARLSAEAIGISANEYINRLPLNRLIQIHVSGPRIRNGHLFDAHETLQEEDYELLNYVLQQSKPQVVTLEYIRQADALREQLFNLRSVIVKYQ